MFKSRTVFIIGAGASREADLPMGEELKGQIADLLDIRFADGWRQASGDDQITAALRQHVRSADGRQGDINPYLHKAWQIRDVVPALSISIDNYLDAHQGDEQVELCGKLGIVRAILRAEAGSKLRHVGDGFDRFDLTKLYGTWYSRFFQMLTENVPKSQAHTVFDNVSIITFNYDRCIERFLAQALADYYSLELDKAQSLVQQRLRIFHPYGQVGPLPWQDLTQATPFGSSGADLLHLAKGIKTFTEGRNDEEFVGPMHAEITAAETIVFLGFAFHPLNMQLLAPTKGSDPSRIFATTFGLSEADKDVIENSIFRMLGRRERAYDDPLKPEMANLKCADFFAHYFRSLSAAPDEDLPVTFPSLPEYEMPAMPVLNFGRE